MMFVDLLFLAAVGTTIFIVFRDPLPGLVALVAVLFACYYARDRWWFF